MTAQFGDDRTDKGHHGQGDPNRPGRSSGRTQYQGKLSPPRERERQAWSLYIRGATPAEIARTPDPNRPGQTLYRTADQAGKAIAQAAAYLRPLGGTVEQRDRMLAALESDLVELNRIVATRHPLLDRTGKPVPGAEDPMPKIAALKEIRQTWGRISQLLGLDAAAKFEVNVTSPEQVDLKRQELMERAATIHLLPAVRPVEAGQAVEVRELPAGPIPASTDYPGASRVVGKRPSEPKRSIPRRDEAEGDAG